MNAQLHNINKDFEESIRPELSVVIPLYNEYEVLPLLFSRLLKALDPLKIVYEVIFVDDGSIDGSGEYIVDLAASSVVVKAIRLSRNFGKEAALAAGLKQSAGSATIILDADLQDPPELIPEMLSAWHKGADIVCMKRRCREGESMTKRFSAHVFYRLLNHISHVNIPEDTGDFRLMSRRSLDALNQLPERNRYTKGLFAWVGFPTHVIDYDREPRAAGVSKWDYFDLMALALEGVTSFSVTPLKWMTTFGLITAILGVIFGAWIVLKTLFLGSEVQGYPSLIAMMTFLGGMQLLCIGVVGEYVGKTYFEAKQRPLYFIKDVIDGSNSNKNISNQNKSSVHATE